MKRKTAFAPATIGNVGVGFDVLGFAVDTIGDTVTVTRTENAGHVEIEKITWASQARTDVGAPSNEIPMDPLRNTATVGLFAFIEDLGLKCGFVVSVKKGIPLGSGMGGSAASAVAAIVAANATLAKPLAREALMKYALLGEAAASGGIHADNVAPCLLGGLTLVRSVEPLDVISIPVPQNILSVLVHPNLKINTRDARGVLNPSVALKDMVKQSGNLAAFVSGCHSQSLKLIGRSLQDLIIEPQRKHLIAGFDDVKRAAMENGALGCSISGSGPTVFAWSDNPKKAKAIKTAMAKAFEQAGAGPCALGFRSRTKKARSSDESRTEMKFRSTRKEPGPNRAKSGANSSVTFSEALRTGLAPDGGLYVPENFPKIAVDKSAHDDLPAIAEKVLAPFLVQDVLEKKVGSLCRNAFTFPAPLEILDDKTALLELFHGPTAAFKDFGASFLAECFKNIGPAKTSSKSKWTVLVATSGDTGGAVGAAFSGNPNVHVVILYPKGMISPLQEKQLTCWESNVKALRVRGTFDDCQRLVKEAFADEKLSEARCLTSANSINIGRILPQTTYFAWASLEYLSKTGRAPGFIVPTGNLGNALSALWAKRMGFPISKVIMACNANRSVINYFETGETKKAATIGTLANAMDVGNPSNLERLRDLYPKGADLKKDAAAFSATDEQIKAAVASCEKKWGRVVCPHTATAVHVHGQLSVESVQGDWILVATAHPAKFLSVVEPLVSREVEMPTSLAKLLKTQSHFDEIDARLECLAESLPG